MRVGVPREIKNHEYRVGLTPAGVHALVQRGHQALVQSGAGARVGFADADYASAGATLVGSAQQVYAADMVVKVKELQSEEFLLPRKDQILFAYLHLAPDPTLLGCLLDRSVSGIAYETVTDAAGRLPLLAPMSRIAGRISIQAGAWALQMANGGSGTLLGGVAGVPPGKVVIIGAGESGSHAAQMAAGIGADVTVLDINIDRLETLDQVHCGRIKTAFSEPMSVARHVADADLVIGALLVPGKLASRLISRDLLRRMRSGSAFVDIAIDQGGIADTSRPTSHSAPLFIEEGVVHYCVPNMPSAVARTATLALTQATYPYVLKLADRGLDALKEDAGLANGLQVFGGAVTHRGLAEDTRRAYKPHAAA
ncbi:MAG: alanine dehydrogenase [Betaproteobacteria bacterium RIFCSPLOWO2_02_FULL_63_19]|nr:MAG: alanine dehydrogenase [Betaproteobacteria bacterium RIFCSPLOWO2_02_FULL_63_19]